MTFTNESPLDRTFRILAGLAMLIAGWAHFVTGVWGVALQVFGWVPLATGLLGWCPVYALLGISTNKKRIRARSS
ncbi:MAG TPA: DUF2892 domain-containing protein [Thermoanaerobaculia bacterium]|nr:DUF2892 domain-containing protein [Thermoanaerobaculia bacterium]